MAWWNLFWPWLLAVLAWFTGVAPTFPPFPW